MPHRTRSRFAVFVVLFFAAAFQLTLTAQSQPKMAFVRIERVTSSHPTPGGIEIRSGSALIQITALRDDVLRVRVGPPGSFPKTLPGLSFPPRAHLPFP